jgi:hypothetical protein
MQGTPNRDPIGSLTLIERHRWRVTGRRALRQHDEDQLSALREVARAGGGVTGLSSPGGSSRWSVAPVEMVIEGRRLRARVHRPALQGLKEALSSLASVPLAGVTRYGPYWVLTFKLAAEPIVLLADRLTILPEWGGSALARTGVPGGPLVALPA